MLLLKTKTIDDIIGIATCGIQRQCSIPDFGVVKPWGLHYKLIEPAFIDWQNYGVTLSQPGKTRAEGTHHMCK
jgi:hypothetical protein